MTYDSIKFNTDGILLVKYSDTDILPIKEEINFIKENNFYCGNKKSNNTLAGNIEKEYTLSHKNTEYLNRLISPYIMEYDKLNPCISDVQVLDTDLPITIGSSWINFQKKYEFNPVHRHAGVYSFVLWVQIPYDMEEEMKNPSCINSNTNCPGHIEFLYTNTLGQIKSQKFPTDKKMENMMALFPAQMMHCVYPFFTSDGYRISVSGNYVLKSN
jgi:hypothetical protein